VNLTKPGRTASVAKSLPGAGTIACLAFLAAVGQAERFSGRCTAVTKAMARKRLTIA